MAVLAGSTDERGVSNSPPRRSGRLKTVWMAPKLAFRNLFHDTLSLFVTLTGIVFSVVLVAVQCGLYLGSEQTIAAVLDQIDADLWVAPIGTKSFDDPNFLMGRERYAVLSSSGVKSAEDLIVGFASWRKPRGGATAVLVVGSDWTKGGLKPWSIVEGSLEELAVPDAVAADRTYFADLGIDKLGDTAEINGNRVVVTAITHGIRSFTTLPYVFTNVTRAKSYLGAGTEQASYTLVKITPGADIKQVKASLAARLPDTEVLEHQEFRRRSLDYWLFQTGAGAALIAGAILGLIVGVVIVAQTLYASTKDHLNEFATLRALGASASYIHQVILMQAMISAVVGYIVGMALSLLVVWLAKDSTMVVIMTPGLAAALFGVTIGMCAIAAMSAIMKVTRIDPSGVFSR
jgi:putative ABC transport system permease protein